MPGPPQFDLVCDREIYTSHVNMMTMAGLMIGSVTSGGLSDRSVWVSVIFSERSVWASDGLSASTYQPYPGSRYLCFKHKSRSEIVLKSEG